MKKRETKQVKASSPENMAKALVKVHGYENAVRLVDQVVSLKLETLSSEVVDNKKNAVYFANVANYLKSDLFKKHKKAV